MNCARYEQGLARLLGGEAVGDERERLLAELREHSATCADCRGSGDLVDWLALPTDERDLVDDPGAEYWSTFDARLKPRLEGASRRSRGPWWAVAAAVVLFALWAGWMLRGPGETAETPLVADSASGPTSSETRQEEFPPSLMQSLDQASVSEVEDQLTALEELGSAWDGGWSSGAGQTAESVWDGALFPEVEQLDAETRERLLDWLRDQNRGVEGAKG